MTRALVKSANGWRYHGGAVGDEHIFTAKTDYTVESDVDTVVDVELAEATDDANTVALAAEVVPRNGDDAPYDDFGLGDATSWGDIDAVRTNFRTVQFRVADGNLSNVRVGVGVNSRTEDDIARQQHLLDLYTPGALSGRSDSVTATNLGVGINFGELSTSEWTYQQSGELVAELVPADPSDEGHSDDWPVDEPATVYRVRWALTQAGDTDTIVHIRLNGGGPFSRTTGSVTSHFFHEVVIPAGALAPDDDTNDGMYTNQAINKGDVVSVATHAAGSFARGLVIRVMRTSQT